MKKEYVGEFNETDLKYNRDKEAVKSKQALFPTLKYVLTKLTKKNTMHIWISDTF